MIKKLSVGLTERDAFKTDEEAKNYIAKEVELILEEVAPFFNNKSLNAVIGAFALIIGEALEDVPKYDANNIAVSSFMKLLKVLYPNLTATESFNLVLEDYCRD